MSDFLTYLNLNRHELLDQLEKRIKPKRFKHVLSVETTALDLARQYGVDEVKAQIAALLHDFAKDMPHDQMLALALQKWPEPLLREANDNIWHGFAAAQYAISHFGLKDPQIIEAICAHTIGWFTMDPLTKVIYMADYIEPLRIFPGVEYARQLLKEDLNAAVEYKMTSTISHLVEKKQAIFLPTVAIYNQWINRRDQ